MKLNPAHYRVWLKIHPSSRITEGVKPSKAKFDYCGKTVGFASVASDRVDSPYEEEGRIGDSQFSPTSISWHHAPPLILHSSSAHETPLWTGSVQWSTGLVSWACSQRALVGTGAGARRGQREEWGLSWWCWASSLAQLCEERQLTVEYETVAQMVCLAVNDNRAVRLLKRLFQKHCWCWYKLARLQSVCHLSGRLWNALAKLACVSRLCLNHIDPNENPSY